MSSLEIADLQDRLTNMAGLMRAMDQASPDPGSNREPAARLMDDAARLLGKLAAERHISATAWELPIIEVAATAPVSRTIVVGADHECPECAKYSGKCPACHRPRPRPGKPTQDSHDKGNGVG